MITFVWAEDRNGAIGLNGHLPWNLPADMRHFKELTMGHAMIMGRKTFASFTHPLKGRQHIVLSRNKFLAQKYAHDSQVTILNSLEKLNIWLSRHSNEKVCAIGGVAIFQALLDQVDQLEQTKIDAVFPADTKMPQIDYSQFKLIKKIHHDPDEKNKYPYTFLTYIRK